MAAGQGATLVQNRAVDEVRSNAPRQNNLTGQSDEGREVPPAPKMKGDDEFGEQMILARRAHAEPWTAGAISQYFYTNNVALTPKNELEDTYFRTGFFAQYTNRIVNDWFLDGAISSYWFLHGKYDFFNFHLFRAEVGVTRRLPWLNDSFASVHYYWFNIADPELRGSIFQNHMLNLNLQKIWKISRGQQLTLGGSADLCLAARPAGPGRHELTAYVNHSLRVTEKWTLQAGLRGGFFHYPDMNRSDWNAGLSVGANYGITDWARLMLSLYATTNHSNLPAFSYNNLATGGGLALQLSF